MIFHFVQRRPLEAAVLESEDDAMFGDRWWYLDGLLTLSLSVASEILLHLMSMNINHLTGRFCT